VIVTVRTIARPRREGRARQTLRWSRHAETAAAIAAAAAQGGASPIVSARPAALRTPTKTVRREGVSVAGFSGGSFGAGFFSGPLIGEVTPFHPLRLLLRRSYCFASAHVRPSPRRPAFPRVSSRVQSIPRLPSVRLVGLRGKARGNPRSADPGCLEMGRTSYRVGRR
jgi:hypothetical protein